MEYAKLLAALGGFLGVLSSVLLDGVLGPEEYEVLVSAAVAAFFVWRLPNKPPA